MTNRELITSALRMLSVLDADQTASTEDAALGLDQLNDLMVIGRCRRDATQYP